MDVLSKLLEPQFLKEVNKKISLSRLLQYFLNVCVEIKVNIETNVLRIYKNEKIMILVNIRSKGKR